MKNNSSNSRSSGSSNDSQCLWFRQILAEKTQQRLPDQAVKTSPGRKEGANGSPKDSAEGSIPVPQALGDGSVTDLSCSRFTKAAENMAWIPR